MNTYKIAEIFHSLQGEGFWSGTPVIFIRFAGCNKKCDFCDTDFKQTMELNAHEVLKAIQTEERKCGMVDRLVFTGGEPMLQLDMELLEEMEMGWGLHIETNGSIAIPEDMRRVLDWVTVSPKAERLNVRKGSELKVVYQNQPDSYFQELGNLDFQGFFLQPCSMKNIPETVEAVKRLPGWRLSIQMHKVVNIR